LPPCGLYKTTEPLPNKEEWVREDLLVYFHNHSQQGPPLLLLPASNAHNRWSFHEKGYLVRDPSFVSTLVDHGGRPRTCVADEDEAEYVVDLPPETNVREFLEMLEDGFPSTELVARRDVERSVGSREELVDTVLGGLTDRQREVLSTAYFAGFFEWPRESTGEDVADMLDVSQPTINRHLRLAQREILRELLSEDVPRVASPKE